MLLEYVAHLQVKNIGATNDLLPDIHSDTSSYFKPFKIYYIKMERKKAFMVIN